MLLRLLFLAGLALPAASACAAQVDANDAPEAVRISQQLAVKILRGGGEGAQFVGTGFAFISQGRALAVTNAHVAALGLSNAPPGGGLHVIYPGATGWHAASSVLAVPQADLAIIETDVTAARGNSYALGIAGLGDTVYSISYDQEKFQQADPLLFKGQVVGIAGALFPSSVLLVKPPAPPDAVKAYVIDGSDCVYGASGSMVLNAQGQLIAVNAGRTDNGLCIAVAVEELVRALQR